MTIGEAIVAIVVLACAWALKTWLARIDEKINRLLEK